MGTMMSTNTQIPMIVPIKTQFTGTDHTPLSIATSTTVDVSETTSIFPFVGSVPIWMTYGPSFAYRAVPSA